MSSKNLAVIKQNKKQVEQINKQKEKEKEPKEADPKKEPTGDIKEKVP